MSTLSNLISQWILQQTAHLSLVAFREVIFRPLRWPVAATQLFTMIRTLVMAGLATLVGWTLLGTMWPALLIGSLDRMSPWKIIERAITVGFLCWAVIPAIQWLLVVNNQMVLALVDSVTVSRALSPAASGLSPIISALIVLVSAVLLLYLGVLYALRTIEIFVLTALAPMVLAWSGLTGDQGPTGRWVREMLVAIFVQSVHAAVYWLYLSLLWSARVSEFEAIGVLLYMIRIPTQLRRLLGLSGGNSLGLWQ